jgi:hypothetical protein
MCDSGLPALPEMGGASKRETPAHVVDGQVPIHALPVRDNRYSSRRSSPPSLDFLFPPGAGKKEIP